MIKVKLIFFVSVLTLVGCKKDIFDANNNLGGCTDIDAINFNNEADFEDNSCLYAYIQEYEISYYPVDFGEDVILNNNYKLNLRHLN